MPSIISLIKENKENPPPLAMEGSTAGLEVSQLKPKVKSRTTQPCLYQVQNRIRYKITELRLVVSVKVFQIRSHLTQYKPSQQSSCPSAHYLRAHLQVVHVFPALQS